MSRFLIFIAFTLCLQFSKAQENKLNLVNISEPCGQLFVTQDFDPEWEKSAGLNENTTWYIPFASKLDVYRLTEILFECPDFETITEPQLINSCITLRKNYNQFSLTVNGYNGKKSVVEHLVPILPKITRFEKTFYSGIGGQWTIILSDSKSYNLLDICYDDGTRSFAAVSLKRTMDEGTLNIIKAHVKSLGFKENQFLSKNYADCVEKDGILMSKGDAESLPKPAKPQANVILHTPYLLSPVVVPKYYVVPTYG